MDNIRGFIAFPISNELLDKLGEVQKSISKGMHHLRPVKPDGIHITLHFLGLISESQVYKIGEMMENVCKKHKVMELECKQIGGFPDMDSPRVLWAGLEGDTKALTNLYQDLGIELAKMEFKVETRPYHPHLTLFRTKSQKQLGTLRKRVETQSKVVFGQVKCDTLILYKSELRPEGAKYTKLKMVALD